MSLTTVRRAVVVLALSTLLFPLAGQAATRPEPGFKAGLRSTWVARALEIWTSFVLRTTTGTPQPTPTQPEPPHQPALGPAIDPLGVPKDPVPTTPR